MIDIALMQSLYKKITGKDYDPSRDNEHEIAEMLRNLLKKGCFDGYVPMASPTVFFERYKTPSGEDYLEYTKETNRHINRNVNVYLPNISFKSFALVDYSGTSFMSLKDIFLHHITAAPTCPDVVQWQCGPIVRDVYIDVTQIGGTSPEELVYIDFIRQSPTHSPLQYNASSNGGVQYIEDLADDVSGDYKTVVFDVNTSYVDTYNQSYNNSDLLNDFIAGDKVVVAYRDATFIGTGYNGDFGTVIFKGIVDSVDISNNKITIKLQKDGMVNDLTKLTNLSSIRTHNDDGKYFNIGKIIPKTKYPKAFVVRTAQDELAKHTFKVEIKSSNPEIFNADIVDDEYLKRNYTFVNFGQMYGINTASTDSLTDFNMFDIDVSGNHERIKINFEDITVTNNSGLPRTVSSNNLYGTKRKDLVFNQNVYLGPHGHLFDNFGMLSQKYVSQAISKLADKFYNEENVMYKNISDNNLAKFLTLVRLIPSGLDEFKTKQRIWYDLTNFDISTPESLQDVPVFFYEYKEKTRTVLATLIHKDLVTSDFDIYTNPSNPHYKDFNLYLEDNNPITNDPNVDSVDKYVYVNENTKYVIILWKLKFVDNVIIDTVDLKKEITAYVKTDSTSNIVYAKMHFKIYPGLSIKFSSLDTKYKNALLSAPQVVGSHYPGCVAEAGFPQEGIKYWSPVYIAKVADGNSSSSTNMLIDLLPEDNMEDKLYIPHEFSGASYTVYFRIHGIDTTNSAILDKLKSNFVAYMTTHKGMGKYNADVISDPIIEQFENPHTGNTENVVIISATFNPSTMSEIAENLDADTIVIGMITDDNKTDAYVTTQSNIYIPAIIDESLTGTIDSSLASGFTDGHNMTFGALKTYGVLSSYSDTDYNFSARAIPTYGDPNYIFGPYDWYGSSETDCYVTGNFPKIGLSLNSDNIITLSNDYAIVQFKGKYMHRCIPIFSAMDDGGSDIPDIYNIRTSFYTTPYIERNKNYIKFKVVRKTLSQTFNQTTLNGLQPTLVDFAIIPGAIDTFKVREKLYELANIKSRYIIGGTTTTDDNPIVNPGDNNGTRYTMIHPSCGCNEGGNGTGDSTITYMVTGDAAHFVVGHDYEFDGKIYTYNGNNTFTEKVLCPQVNLCPVPDPNNPPTPTESM